MFSPDEIYRAPPNSGKVILGRTLPSLLDEACDRHPNPQALNHWTDQGWQSLSTQAFQTAAEEIALGLLELGLVPGDRVGLLMHSDNNFCLADMGTLLARLVNVPIHLTETSTNITFILQQTEAKVLIASDLNLLRGITPCLSAVATLQYLQFIVVAETPPDWRQHLPRLPRHIQILSLAAVREQGQAQFSAQRQHLRTAIAPNALATIVYTAGATGQPKGVMLTHENLSANVLAAFTGFPGLKPGVPEVALSYLPLTHIFARAFLYGHLNYGHCLYFTTPNRVIRHLKDVQPTIFTTVPRLLEKVYQKIHESRGQLKGFAEVAFQWAMRLAQRYELGQKPGWPYAQKLKLADRLIFARWRSLFGKRLKYLISGGAALQPDIANLFAAAGIVVFQGYGLTETSSVLCCNRGEFNRAGTVGVPIAGVEMAIAPDGEILARAPYIMQGYYKDPEATRAVIDEEGWFHTGDLGEFTPEGFLKITGYKKNLFKLSTGKYVTPQPLEQRLQQSSLVERAITVGAQRKFCSMLIFPNLEHLRERATAMGLDLPPEQLLQHPRIIELYQQLIDAANAQLPHWSKVKQFQLIHSPLSIEASVLTPALRLSRAKVSEVFAPVIESIYAEAEKQAGLLTVVPMLPLLNSSTLHSLMGIGVH